MFPLKAVCKGMQRCSIYEDNIFGYFKIFLSYFTCLQGPIIVGLCGCHNRKIRSQFKNLPIETSVIGIVRVSPVTPPEASPQHVLRPLVG